MFNRTTAPDKGALFSYSPRQATAIRAAVAIIAVPLSLFLLEYPSNPGFLSMAPLHLAANLAIMAVLFAIVYFFGQRSRISIAVFMALCLLAGSANHFVIEFKGQPIVPADLFALDTAASVSGGYELVPDEGIVAGIVVFVVACAALVFFVPKAQVKQRGVSIAVNVAVGLALAGGFSWWMSASDIEEDFSCKVDVWSVRESYASQGTLLCFLQRMQDLVPDEPAGYDSSAVGELVAAAAASALPQPVAEELPNVVVIMNETFSDLSRYPGLAGTAAEPVYYNQLASEALISGNAYVSALGGGTCNSEFEFLTGSSMGHLGGGVYPYVLYDLKNTDSMVSQLSSLGYATTAIHPADAANWRRDRVYSQLGFDRFDDITTFDEPDRLRDLVTDRATYDRVLEVLEEGEGPQLVFDVTIQNHGGYTTGKLDEDKRVNVELAGEDTSELSEYLSCIQAADADLAYLIERLSELDEPVVLCFFGDHQPGFADWLYQTTYGTPLDAEGLAGVQTRFTVPYLVWANYDASATAAAEASRQATTSLNYLGAQTLSCAGVPLSAYQQFLLSVREQVPAINMNGYQTADSNWHWFDEDTDAADALDRYAWAQYANLFG